MNKKLNYSLIQLTNKNKLTPKSPKHSVKPNKLPPQLPNLPHLPSILLSKTVSFKLYLVTNLTPRPKQTFHGKSKCSMACIMNSNSRVKTREIYLKMNYRLDKTGRRRKLVERALDSCSRISMRVWEGLDIYKMLLTCLSKIGKIWRIKRSKMFMIQKKRKTLEVQCCVKV